MNKVRVDKWLWSVRIYKSRSKASTACKAGKISIAGENLKPSYLITIGDKIEVKKNGFNLLFQVDKLIQKRVSATLAAPCYKDLTPDDELNKYKDWYVGKGMPERRQKGDGRPTKKERRILEEFKDVNTDWYNIDE